MRKVKAGMLLALFMGVVSTSAQAATITFDQTGDAGGSITFAGGPTPMIGGGIMFNEITVSGAPVNSGVDLVCTACFLSFQTEAASGGGPNFVTFDGGGATFFTLTGTILPQGTFTGTAGNLITGTVT